MSVAFPYDDDGWMSSDDGGEEPPDDDYDVMRERILADQLESRPFGDALDEAAEDDPFIDWAEFWARDPRDAEWVFDEVLARGRGHVLYADAKSGKSLLLLYIAKSLATCDGRYVVIYLDYEMTEDDLQERLEDMGVGPDSDLSRLRYWPIPSMPALDTTEGAAHLDQRLARLEEEWPDHHLVVLIDTMGQAVKGSENDADTYRDFARFTGAILRRRGVTFVRADHAGKEASRRQRGSSAKAADVDVVWQLRKTAGGVELKRDAARMSWVPAKVVFAIETDPLRYERTDVSWPQGTVEVAAILDRLQIPVELSGNAAFRALREHGEGRGRETVLAAVKHRRQAK